MNSPNFDDSFNQTLKVANALAICLIVAIHYNSKIYISTDDGYTINYLIQEWISNSVARAAVPFFAFAAGYFYFTKFGSIKDYSIQTKKRFYSLLVPYFLAVSLIFLFDVVIHLIKDQEFEFTIKRFLYYLMHPDSVQFWFLRDLIVLTFFLTPVLYFVLNLIPKITLTIIFILWLTETQPFPLAFGWYIVSVEVLMFFLIGAALSQRKYVLERLLGFIVGNGYIVVSFFVFISLLRVALAPEFGTWYGVRNGGIFILLIYKLNIILGIFSLYLIANAKKDNRFLEWISTFSFFIFLYHIKPVSTFSINAASLVLPDQYLFYLVTPLSIAICIMVAIVIKRIAPKFYRLLSGGR